MKNSNRFGKYDNGIITIEIQSFAPEKFINILWKNGINTQNVTKKSITTVVFDIKLSDFDTVKDLSYKTDSKIKIIKRRGNAFLLLKLKKRKALLIAIFLFIGILYYLSTFIWEIDIKSGHNLTPYEIRQSLLSIGIKDGVSKKKVNTYDIEEKLQKANENILWIKVRIEGSKLKIEAEERQIPPDIIEDETPCNLVADKDASIVRVYTKAGTAVVKNNDVVKKGQLLVKGEQGTEDNMYFVHAEGEVIAKTFYEESGAVAVKGIKRQRTGRHIENIYIIVNNKRINIKNSLNTFKKYDRIDKTGSFINKEIFYEIKEESYSLDAKKVIEDTSQKLYDVIIRKFDKNVNVIDKKVSYEHHGDFYIVNVLVIAEENIAVPQKM